MSNLICPHCHQPTSWKTAGKYYSEHVATCALQSRQFDDRLTLLREENAELRHKYESRSAEMSSTDTIKLLEKMFESEREEKRLISARLSEIKQLGTIMHQNIVAESKKTRKEIRTEGEKTRDELTSAISAAGAELCRSLQSSVAVNALPQYLLLPEIGTVLQILHGLPDEIICDEAKLFEQVECLLSRGIDDVINAPAHPNHAVMQQFVQHVVAILQHRLEKRGKRTLAEALSARYVLTSPNKRARICAAPEEKKTADV